MTARLIRHVFIRTLISRRRSAGLYVYDIPDLVATDPAFSPLTMCSPRSV
jgi:hypothetical protein